LGYKGFNLGVIPHIQKAIGTKIKARMEVTIHVSIKHKTNYIE
jgi:hypothetical protein